MCHRPESGRTSPSISSPDFSAAIVACSSPPSTSTTNSLLHSSLEMPFSSSSVRRQGTERRRSRKPLEEIILVFAVALSCSSIHVDWRCKVNHCFDTAQSPSRSLQFSGSIRMILLWVNSDSSLLVYWPVVSGQVLATSSSHLISDHLVTYSGGHLIKYSLGGHFVQLKADWLIPGQLVK